MREEHPELLTPGRFYHGGNEFEEDCEVSRIILAFPDSFSKNRTEQAMRWLIDYHPDMYEAYTGKAPEVLESHALRAQAFSKMVKNFYVSVSARGSWDENTPDGFVSCLCIRGGRDCESSSTPEDRAVFLIPEEEYDARPRGGEYSFYFPDDDMYERIA